MSRHWRTWLWALTLGFLLCCGRRDAPAVHAEVSPDNPKTDKLTGIDPLYREKIRALQAQLDSMNANGDEVERARAHGQLAMLFHAFEYYEPAREHYLAAIALQDGNFQWHYLLGRVYQQLLDLEKARERFLAAREREPTYVPALLALGEGYRAENRLDLAETTFQQALELQKDCVPAMIRLAQTANLKKDYRKAAALMEEALALQPQAAPAHYTAASAYRGLGDLEKARYHLEHRDQGQPAVLKDPAVEALQALANDPDEHFEWGARALEEDRFGDAVRYLRIAVEQKPAHGEFRQKLAWALLRSGNRQKALAQFAEAAQLNPDNANIHYNMGGLLLEMGAVAEAAAAFQQTIELEPANAAARFYLAETLRFDGRFEEAGVQYDKTITLQVHHVPARLGRALMAIRTNRLAAARAYLEKDLKAIPAHPVLLHVLIRLLAAAPDSNIRDGQRAASLVAALEQDPLQMGLAETLAMVAAENGDFERAVRWQQTALTQFRNKGSEASINARLAILEGYRQGQPCRQPWLEEDDLFTKKPYRF